MKSIEQLVIAAYLHTRECHLCRAAAPCKAFASLVTKFRDLYSRDPCIVPYMESRWSPGHGPILPLDVLDHNRRACIKKRDWLGYLITFGSHQRFQPLRSIIPMLQDHEYWPTISDTWIGIEWLGKDRKEWERMLFTSRPIVGAWQMMSEEDQIRFGGLPEQFLVYRGQASATDNPGFSWSLSREVAENFASKYRKRFTGGAWRPPICPVVFEAEVRKEHCLCLLNGRNEMEVLLHPKHAKVKQIIPVAPLEQAR